MMQVLKRKQLISSLLAIGMLTVGAVTAAGFAFFGKVGPQADGTGITPNNWILSPAGLQLEVGDRPMGVALSPDGHYLAVVNCGQGVQGLTLIDAYTRRVTQTIPYPAPEALYVGVTWSADGKNLYASAGGNNKIRTYSFDAGKLSENSSIVLGDSSTPIFLLDWQPQPTAKSCMWQTIWRTPSPRLTSPRAARKRT